MERVQSSGNKLEFFQSSNRCRSVILWHRICVAETHTPRLIYPGAWKVVVHFWLAIAEFSKNATKHKPMQTQDSLLSMIATEMFSFSFLQNDWTGHPQSACWYTFTQHNPTKCSVVLPTHHTPSQHMCSWDSQDAYPPSPKEISSKGAAAACKHACSTQQCPMTVSSPTIWPWNLWVEISYWTMTCHNHCWNLEPPLWNQILNLPRKPCWNCIKFYKVPPAVAVSPLPFSQRKFQPSSNIVYPTQWLSPSGVFERTSKSQ